MQLDAPRNYCSKRHGACVLNDDNLSCPLEEELSKEEIKSMLDGFYAIKGSVAQFERMTPRQAEFFTNSEYELPE